ncbi:MAG: beta-glucosidase [Candidatus Krumholzibacteriota bacterium]|nr:beta-glucosidase [Candidatus Krumholzibacteriota bacterium]
MKTHKFPEDFIWGVATSAQQIEGAYDEGGRGESIWDRFAAIPGRISDGSNANRACDHYHLWRGDVELMKWLGIGAYRFSISWPRILPHGSGKINEAGLDFYDSLVDALLKAGIKPFVTLYHWDLPQKLQDHGGWVSRDTAKAFIEYTAAVTDRLGDRVADWTTHNEPWCIANLSYEEGEHAPGHRDPAEALSAAHHVMLSHGWAVEEIRRRVPGSRAGIVLNLVPVEPASGSGKDHEAARWFDGKFNRWYLDPIFRGSYPEDAIRDRVARGHLANAELPFLKVGDLDIISVPIDFLGINYYSRVIMKAEQNSGAVEKKGAPSEELTDMGWEVYPEGLYKLLSRVSRDYDPKNIYITENGAAYSDGPDESGRIRDERRVEYFRGHIESVHRAVSDGIRLKGYFAWSLLDNFEWAHGYTKRFGLYWVDYDSLRRIPKDSAFYYREVIESNSV